MKRIVFKKEDNVISYKDVNLYSIVGMESNDNKRRYCMVRFVDDSVVFIGFGNIEKTNTRNARPHALHLSCSLDMENVYCKYKDDYEFYVFDNTLELLDWLKEKS